VSNAPSKPVSFSRPKVGYFSNRPRILTNQITKFYDFVTFLQLTAAVPDLHPCSNLHSGRFNSKMLVNQFVSIINVTAVNGRLLIDGCVSEIYVQYFW